MIRVALDGLRSRSLLSLGTLLLLVVALACTVSLVLLRRRVVRRGGVRA